MRQTLCTACSLGILYTYSVCPSGMTRRCLLRGINLYAHTGGYKAHAWNGPRHWTFEPTHADGRKKPRDNLCATLVVPTDEGRGCARIIYILSHFPIGAPVVVIIQNEGPEGDQVKCAEPKSACGGFFGSTASYIYGCAQWDDCNYGSAILSVASVMEIRTCSTLALRLIDL